MKNLLFIILLFTACQKPVDIHSPIERKMVLETSEFNPTDEQYAAFKANASAQSAKPTGTPGKGPKPKPTPPPEDTVVVTPPPAGTGLLVFVNFDGELVNEDEWYLQEATQQPFYAPAANLTAEDKQVVIDQVTFDLQEFKATITTDRFVYLNSMLPKVNVVVTPYTFKTGGSGFAFLGSAFYDIRMCFVFTERLFNLAAYIGKVVTHEVGHTIGLYHQSTYNPDGSLQSRYRDRAHMGVSWSYQADWVYGTTYAPDVYQDDRKVWKLNVGAWY